MPRGSTPPSADRAIADLATDQLGVVGRTQLFALGLTVEAVDERVRLGRLLSIHPSVYCVGHRSLTVRARWRAALLASPSGAVLSHGSAAAVWELLAPGATIHVSVPGRTGRLHLTGVVAHRPRSLPADEVDDHDGFAVTTVARTLVDLAAVVRRGELERAVNQAEFHRHFDLPAIQTVLARSNGRKGTRRLRDVIAAWRGFELTRSQLEDAFQELCRAAHVPAPMVNVPIACEGGPYVADFLWPDRRLIIETDGFESHSTRSAHRGDRRRDRHLRRMDYAVERFTWEDVFLDPVATTTEIVDILARNPPLPRNGGVT